MKRLIAYVLLAVFFIGAIGFWLVTEPRTVNSNEFANHEVDIANGELVFWAGGCASCHASKDAKGDDKLLLGGGHPLETPFGTFVTPNISPDTESGIGAWSAAEFINAMKFGVSPEGKHYYPSFPYASYARMTDKDVVDLFGFMKILPVVNATNQQHDLPLPFQWRRTLGVWKAMFMSDEPIIQVAGEDDLLKRGQYLVEGMAHCGECHTPRNLIGGPDNSNWLVGGPSPEGKGNIPNITPHDAGIGGWSEDDIVYYLESGFTPDYDSAGGSMTDVVSNMAKLPKIELEAIAKYLKSVPAKSN